MGDIGTVPNSLENVPHLLQQVVSHARSLVDSEPQARLKLLAAARSLVNALETPREAMIRLWWSQSAFAAIQIAIDLGIFALMANNAGAPTTVNELSSATGADPVLLGRVMKHLGAMGVVEETGTDEYRNTGFSTALTIQKYADGFPCVTGCVTPAILQLPAYLKKTGYKNPRDGKDGPFQYGLKTHLDFFEFLDANPVIHSQYNSTMAAYRQGRASWMDPGFYPVQSNLVDGASTEKDSVFLVDVGGNKGHDLEEFRAKWPDVPGRLILQDQEAVIGQIKKIHSSIEPMAHDFFTEQPVKGARAYYMHSVLHDWPDEVCLKILSNLVPAMKRGYSKILINENVIPSTGAEWESTALDLAMMAVHSAQERTEDHWTKLITSAGLKIVKIWTYDKGVESLIECELAD
ncbi:hypothetical protein VTO42DRAFT_1192 [Malbranchea cinnamomea]